MRVIPLNKLKNHWTVYLLILLPLGLVLLFNYYPIINGFVHIFYRWDGDRVEEYVGLGNIVRMFNDADLLRSLGVILIFIAANLVKMIPPIITAVILHHVLSSRMRYIYRICFVIPMIVPGVVSILLWKYFYEPSAGVMNSILRAAGCLGATETIQWLSDSRLVIPSLILMGFPWVGAFGVLIYLAGLGNISRDLYDAAKLDGAGAMRTFFSIELPLIMTQVRINLVLMMIGTLTGWEFVYLMLGESGGPNGVATVPGLLIFREAFNRGLFGYGCAVGFLIFLITLGLTGFNNRYVRVEK